MIIPLSCLPLSSVTAPVCLSSSLPSFILPPIPLFLCVGTSARGSRFPLCCLSALWAVTCSCSPFIYLIFFLWPVWPHVTKGSWGREGTVHVLVTPLSPRRASPGAEVAVLQEPPRLAGVCNRFQDSLLSLSLLSPHLCKHMKETWESIKPQKTNHGQNKYTVC